VSLRRDDAADGAGDGRSDGPDRAAPEPELATRTAAAHEIPRSAGLCAGCVHARTVVTVRGSVFVLCEAAASDPLLARYPALPRRSCHGFEPSAETAV
jgi:hypothetical protein